MRVGRHYDASFSVLYQFRPPARAGRLNKCHVQETTTVSRISIPSAFLLAIVLASTVRAEPNQPMQWPQFRGPGGAAIAPHAKLPDAFDPDTNVLWKVPTPAGSSSPCIWGDRLFLTGQEGDEVRVLCYRRDDGQLLWQRAFKMALQEDFAHDHCSPAAPTCCTDGKYVVSYFGGFGLVCHDFEGQQIWEKKFAAGKEMFGTGTSPILSGDAVYLARDVSGDSGLYCFDVATGDERWMAPRPHASTNYATPFVWQRPERREVVVAGTTTLTSYDAGSGDRLWTIRNMPVFICPSPVASDDTLFFGAWTTANVPGSERNKYSFDESLKLTEEEMTDTRSFIKRFDTNQDSRIERNELPPSRARDAFRFLDVNRNDYLELDELEPFTRDGRQAPGRNVLVAVRGGGEGDISDTHVLWERTKGIPYVASPLLFKGRLYYVKRGGMISCLDAESGEAYFEAKRLGVAGEYYATPVGVGDHVLILAERGTLFVLRAADQLDIVSKVRFEEALHATPAIVDNKVYVRTAAHLYAFGNE